MDTLADLQSGEFAILLRTESTYMQAAVVLVAGRRRSRRKRRSEGESEPVVTCHLEYQDGSLEEHYEVAGGPVQFHRVAEAFRSYAAGDNAWQTEFPWSRMHLL
jgi:hypothetical protein